MRLAPSRLPVLYCTQRRASAADTMRGGDYLRCYEIDLRGLPPEERLTACRNIDLRAFEIGEIYGKNGLEGVNVLWDSAEDFLTCSAFPQGCPCREVK